MRGARVRLWLLLRRARGLRHGRAEWAGAVRVARRQRIAQQGLDGSKGSLGAVSIGLRLPAAAHLHVHEHPRLILQCTQRLLPSAGSLQPCARAQAHCIRRARL